MKNSEYKINMNIPGWNGIEILTRIAEISSRVPDNGNILELGALFGRTTYAIGHNKNTNTKLYVIDCWGDILYKNHVVNWFHDKKCGDKENKLIENYYKADIDGINGVDFYALWHSFTNDIPNLVSFRNLTLMPNDNFPFMDLIIHDAGHDYQSVYKDLTHWLPKLKQDGMIIVDDYDKIHFIELVKAVDTFVSENNLDSSMLTSRNIILKRKTP